MVNNIKESWNKNYQFNFNILLPKTWTAIDWLSITKKPDILDKIRHDFFPALAEIVQLYGYTTWSLAKSKEKKLYTNHTRMLRTDLEKTWKLQLTK